MVYIGIDPGKNGGFAIIDDKGGVHVESWDNQEFAGNVRIASNENIRVIACVEKVGAMPGQGVTSMFSFGKAAGFIEGVLTSCNVPFQLVPPATWKKEFSLIGGSKQKSIEVAKRLFPGVSLRRTNKCTVDHDGMAEALLLAEYARRRFGS